MPKKNGKWPVIMHLSAPPGHSVNDYIPREQFTLTHVAVDTAVRLLATLGKDALMAKADLKAAFCNIPINLADWDRLGIFWRGQYYIDTRLPIGLRSAPFLFNQYARALLWIVQTMTSPVASIIWTITSSQHLLVHLVASSTSSSSSSHVTGSALQWHTTRRKDQPRP